jgi:uncharacterized protein
MLWLAALGTGAVAGAASLAHCVAMCGPLTLLAAGGGGRRAVWAWQAGRLITYTAAGTAAGLAGAAISDALSSPWLGAGLSWVLALTLLVIGARLWRRSRAPVAAPATERTGAPALVPVGRTRRSLSLAARVLARLPRHPFVLGAATALLPCGALAAALLLAAGTRSPGHGAISMAAFAASSGVGLALAGVIAGALRGLGRHATRALAVALIAGALVSLYRPIPGLLAPEPTCPMHARGGS